MFRLKINAAKSSHTTFTNRNQIALPSVYIRDEKVIPQNEICNIPWHAYRSEADMETVYSVNKWKSLDIKLRNMSIAEGIQIVTV